MKSRYLNGGSSLLCNLHFTPGYPPRAEHVDSNRFNEMNILIRIASNKKCIRAPIERTFWTYCKNVNINVYEIIKATHASRFHFDGRSNKTGLRFLQRSTIKVWSVRRREELETRDLPRRYFHSFRDSVLSTARISSEGAPRDVEVPSLIRPAEMRRHGENLKRLCDLNLASRDIRCASKES